jgi:hypothetical protein
LATLRNNLFLGAVHPNEHRMEAEAGPLESAMKADGIS